DRPRAAGVQTGGQHPKHQPAVWWFGPHHRWAHRVLGHHAASLRWKLRMPSHAPTATNATRYSRCPTAGRNVVVPNDNPLASSVPCQSGVAQATGLIHVGSVPTGKYVPASKP